MKLLSLFDGEGGFPLAGVMCGIEPVYASEIEPFPIAVTRSRFPNMKHLGNVSEVNGAEIEPVDIVTFGSPCQDMSVAGKRAGLKHDDLGDEETTRSGLFFESIRIIKEMRSKTNGRYPRFAVWENVPGAFSSNGGRDFLAVLQAFASVCEPAVSIPEPERDSKTDNLIWSGAGSIVGNGWSLAWRQLDAQYFGVPQRRKRIYLVADFSSERAEEILFERHSLRGDSAQSGEAREGTSENAQRCVDGMCSFTATAFGKYEDGCGTLRASGGDCGNGSESIIVQSFGFAGKASPAAGSIGFDKECAATLRCGQQTHVIALQANGIDRADTAGCNGAGWREDQSYTLNTVDRHAVCYQENIGSVCARDCKGVGSQYVDEGKLVVEKEIYPDICGTLAASGAECSRTAGQGNEADFCIVSKSDSARRYIVRRLMPIETLRLQGYKDFWHDLAPFDNDVDFWENVRKTWANINGTSYRPCKDLATLEKWYYKLRTDAAEYKADGNSLAIPCAAYVMRRIKEFSE